MDKILIVDDNVDALQAYKRILKNSEYEILCLSDSVKAFIETLAYKPDILVLDIMMPVLNGYEICKMIKNDSRTKDVEVLFISAKDSTQDRLYAYEVQGNDYLTKPFNSGEFLAKLEIILSRKHRFEEQVYTDTLTGLGNRKYYEDQFSQLCLKAKRYKQIFSIAIIDIDFFKNVNDFYGHEVGDIVLKDIAQRIKDTIRETDIATRFGGEEFVIMMPETQKSDALVILERIRINIRSNIFQTTDSNIEFRITVSAGVAEFPGDSNDKTLLFRFADKALYKAKESGRDQIC